MARRTTAVLAALTGVLLIASVVGAVAVPTTKSLGELTIGLLVAPPAAVLAVVIARRPSGARVGALLGFVGLALVHVTAKEIGRQYLATDHDLARQLAWLDAALDQSALLVLLAVALLLLHFPTGRVPGPRWRWLPAAVTAAVLVETANGALGAESLREPLGFVERPWSTPSGLAPLVGGDWYFLAAVLLALASAISLVARYRGAGPVERRQIKWLALAGLLIVAYPLLCIAEILLWGDPLWFSVAVGVAGLIGIPAAVGVAMLRHDLYDVDKAVAGATTWALLTGCLLATYALASTIVGAVVGAGSGLAPAAAAVLCALGFRPLRRRLQEAVDRRLYPLRRAAAGALDRLHRDVEAGAATPEALESVLRAALRDPGLRVGYRLPDGGGLVDTGGAVVPTTGAVPVELAGEQIGVLVAGPAGCSGELLREVAARATTMVEVVRVRQELGLALREVEASRARLVQIGFEERRRLERDLHDGAQQRLVALGMSLRLAQRHLSDGSVDLPDLLDQSVAELGTAVAELRQLAHGLRPSALDDGLPAALARLVRSLPLPIDMHVDDDPLPDDVATTAYFVIAEAVTNAIKHAEASRIVLKVSRDGAALRVHVSDDGRGGARVDTGSLLADRVAALGGSLTVASPVGSGTTLEVALPCAS